MGSFVKKRYFEKTKNSIFTRVINGFFSKFCFVLDKILSISPLFFSLVVGVIAKPSFSELEISSLFILSVFLYFRILSIMYSAHKTKRVFFSGFIYGMTIYSNGFSWLLSLQEMGLSSNFVEKFLSIFSFLGATLYVSLYLAISAYLAVKLAYNKLSLFLLFSSFLTLFEILSRYIIDLAPLLSLSYGIVSLKYFIQIGAIVGTFGITFLVFFIISLLSVSGYRKYGLGVFWVCCFYGIYKIHFKDDYLMPEEKFDIVVVQPNFDDNDRSYSGYACCDNFGTISNVDNIKNQKRKMLIIAPETIILYRPYQIDYFVKRGSGYYKNDGILNPNRKTNLDKKGRSNIYVCTGFQYKVFNDVYNSYQFFTYDYTMDDILRLDYYNKKYLIPFGETLPSWADKLSKIVPKGIKVFHNMINDIKESSYTVGSVSNTIRLKGISPFAVCICSDIINPGLSLDDSYWPTWILSTMNFHTFNGKNKKTALSHLGLVFGIFRAIEFSRPVVMCINFGWSCVINCNGCVLQRLDSIDAKALYQEMPLKYDISIFSVCRRKIVFLMLFFVFLFLLRNKYGYKGRVYGVVSENGVIINLEDNIPQRKSRTFSMNKKNDDTKNTKNDENINDDEVDVEEKKDVDKKVISTRKSINGSNKEHSSENT